MSEKIKIKINLSKVFALCFLSLFAFTFFAPIFSYALVEGDSRIVPCGYDGARSSGGKVDLNVPIKELYESILIKVLDDGTLKLIGLPDNVVPSKIRLQL
jgi:hypothetical protein